MRRSHDPRHQAASHRAGLAALDPGRADAGRLRAVHHHLVSGRLLGSPACLRLVIVMGSSPSRKKHHSLTGSILIKWFFS